MKNPSDTHILQCAQAWPHHVLKRVSLYYLLMHLMTSLGLVRTSGRSMSSIRQFSMMRTLSSLASVWISESNTQQLLPARLLRLPMTTLWSPAIELLQPTMTLLYWTRYALIWLSRFATSRVLPYSRFASAFLSSQCLLLWGFLQRKVRLSLFFLNWPTLFLEPLDPEYLDCPDPEYRLLWLCEQRFWLELQVFLVFQQLIADFYLSQFLESLSFESVLALLDLLDLLDLLLCPLWSSFDPFSSPWLSSSWLRWPSPYWWW